MATSKRRTYGKDEIRVIEDVIAHNSELSDPELAKLSVAALDRPVSPPFIQKIRKRMEPTLRPPDLR